MAPSPKKGKFFSLSTLFRTGSSSSDRSEFWGLRDGSNEDDEDSLLGSDNNEVSSNGDSKDNKSQLDPDSKDSIAEPIYGLMSEIFDLTGPFKFLRKSLISFVQITCGNTLNRQIRDLISNCFDESNLHHFSSNLLKSLWPAGSLAKPVPERTDDMKEMTSIAAKSLIIDNIPDLLSNLVGAQNAKNGSIKIFEILQNEEYNKQLVYDMLEVLMVEIFPEIKQLPQQHQSNRNNQK